MGPHGPQSYQPFGLGWFSVGYLCLVFNLSGFNPPGRGLPLPLPPLPGPGPGGAARYRRLLERLVGHLAALLFSIVFSMPFLIDF